MTAFDEELLQAGRWRVDLTDDVLTLTLSRPDVRNAQVPETWLALAHVGASLPDEVRVVVVRGDGPSFSAGLDRSAFSADSTLGQVVSAPATVADTMIGGFQAGLEWLSAPGVVTIAAVQGHAVGAGFQLALACDLVLVADDVSFRMAEIGWGLVPDLTGTSRLARAVGRMRALELCATGRPVGAEEALSLGLAVAVHPPQDLDRAVRDLVGVLLQQDDQALRAVSRLCAAADLTPPRDQLARERAEQLPLLRALAARSSGRPSAPTDS